MNITGCALKSEPAGTWFEIAGRGEAAPLSDLMPRVENLGVRVLRAEQHDAGDGWCLRLALEAGGATAPAGAFEATFMAVMRGEFDDDRLNRLVTAAALRPAQVLVLRALIRYGVQLGLPFSDAAMAAVLERHPETARDLVLLFETRFDPALEADRQARTGPVLSRLRAGIEQVERLDDDRVLSALLDIILAIVRTNFYRVDRARMPGAVVGFKLRPETLGFAPAPVPDREMFVFGPDVEGVHLRAGAVARGGIRWSERDADYRTEVLGLLKAQIVKNAVIVPAGAKGGFVCRRLDGLEAGARRGAVEAAYRAFIGALLELADNRVGDRIEPPSRVVRYDDDDPYLVVAADKGTASFSDIANEIACDQGFWLGDAFASGGSQGYDHKKLGITARGAWESVKRLFLELGTDTGREPFRVVGIGDMSGDVFGNGMLLSPQIRLVAAFNHRHIFIDPDPDPAASFAERERLFRLPGSGWDDYDRTLLSADGGVFERSRKQIALGESARRALGLGEEVATLAPDELIRAILRAPVDLLWNGGIGTYVKASDESHADVGDKANDGLRIDASELRVHVVGEGGNLGLTQRARIEYALGGGRLHTDAVDNAGGVDCSDHEVNIKILLQPLVADGQLSQAARDRLLEAMTGDICAAVLANNFAQSKMLSQASHTAPRFVDGHAHLIGLLARAGCLRPDLECLPNDAELAARQQSQQAMTRPEIAVLLAYSKAALYERLAAADLVGDGRMQAELLRYFPAQLRQSHGDRILAHPLRREILAAQLTNQVVNRMGATFCIQLLEDGSADAARLVLAFVAARDLLGIEALDLELDRLAGHLPHALLMELQLRLHAVLYRTLFRIFDEAPDGLGCEALVQRYRAAFDALRRDLPALLPEAERARLASDAGALADAGVPVALAESLARLALLPMALEVEEVRQRAAQPLEACLRQYIATGAEVELHWIAREIESLPLYDKWYRKAREALRDSLLRSARRLTIRALEYDASGVAGLGALLGELRSAEGLNIAMLTTVTGQLSRLAASPETV